MTKRGPSPLLTQLPAQGIGSQLIQMSSHQSHEMVLGFQSAWAHTMVGKTVVVLHIVSLRLTNCQPEFRQ